METCHNCGQPFGPNKNIKFCGQCGEKIPALTQVPCRVCQQKISKTAQFCGHCGASQTKTTKDHTKLGKQTGSRKKKTKWILSILLLSIVGVITLALTAWFFLKDDSSRKRRHRSQSEETNAAMTFAGDQDKTLIGQWPTPPQSGTKAQKVTRGEKIQISVADNALDQERDLELESISEEELAKVNDHPRLEGTLMFDAYHFSAGLKSRESIPGKFEIAYDLSKTDFDPVFYDSIRVVRMGDDENDIQFLNSQVEGSILKATTNRNSIIGFTALGVVCYGAISHEHNKIISAAFGKDPYYHFSNPEMKRYTFFWPVKLGFGNPQALKACWLKEVDLYKKYKILPEDYDPLKKIDQSIKSGQTYNSLAQVLRYNIKNSDKPLAARLAVLAKMAIMTRAPEYKEFKSKITPQWLIANLLPKEVQYSMECARHADHYLFSVRKFKSPASVDVYISEKEQDLGSSYNPALFNPYMTMKAWPPWGEKLLREPLRDHIKSHLDNYLVTFTHELFHVTQSSCYVKTVDWKSNTWFWEATATLLENEAADYYKKTNHPGRKKSKIISSHFKVDRHAYDEAYTRALGLTGYWGDFSSVIWTDTENTPLNKARQQQGYMMGYFLLHLKKHCQFLNSKPKDDFLMRLMNSFQGSIKSPLYTIVSQSTNSWERFEIELKNHLLKSATKISKQVSSESKNKKNVFHGWINEPQFKLSETAPVIEIMPKKNPTGSPIRQLAIKLDKKKYHKKQDVTLVIKRGDDALQNNQDLILNLGNEKQNYQEFKAKTTQAFGNYGLNSLSSIQEIHLYPDGWFNDFEAPYLVILMLKPDAPKMMVKETELSITLPKRSYLWERGLVKNYLVTIVNNQGKTFMLKTDKEELELTIGLSGDFLNIDGADLKKTVDHDMNQLKNSPSLPLDLESMARSAEVIKQIATGQSKDKTIVVFVQEIMEGDQPIIGPVSDHVQHTIKVQNTGRVNILGSWTGKIQIGNQPVNVEITPGKHGFDYIITHSLYLADGIIFYGKELSNGAVELYIGMKKQKPSSKGDPFTTIIKNSNDELYMMAPPTTLKRKP